MDDYLHKRLEPNRLAESDPLKRVSNDMLDRVIKDLTRGILRQSVDSLAQTYLLEAQFFSLFNNVFIKKEIWRTAKEAIEEMYLGEIIDKYLEGVVRRAVPEIAAGEIEAEKDRKDHEEMVYAFEEFTNRVILETMIDNMSRLYEEEEREIHQREQRDKMRRSSANL